MAEAEHIVLPAAGAAQVQAWHALMELHERVRDGWCLIGGQLVHLHCAERGASPVRPTNDVDAVVDVRASPHMLLTFTEALEALGFVAETSGSGAQHRWRRDLAQIDVLIPEGVGERAASRVGAGGAPSVGAPGTTQALARSERVTLEVEGRVGSVLRPTLVGALVGKAAARGEIPADRASGRHCADFVVLAGLVAARDVRGIDLTPKDRRRLRTMVEYCRRDSTAMLVENAEDALGRLVRAAGLAS